MSAASSGRPALACAARWARPVAPMGRRPMCHVAPRAGFRVLATYVGLDVPHGERGQDPTYLPTPGQLRTSTHPTYLPTYPGDHHLHCSHSDRSHRARPPRPPLQRSRDGSACLLHPGAAFCCTDDHQCTGSPPHPLASDHQRGGGCLTPTTVTYTDMRDHRDFDPRFDRDFAPAA